MILLAVVTIPLLLIIVPIIALINAWKLPPTPPTVRTPWESSMTVPITETVVDRCPEHPDGWIVTSNGRVVEPCDRCAGRS